ncbi:MAG TPA: hypothetical protein VJQ54_25205 [Candidatus Sulfotelmatobacter sp.]|nr:hypothetical protein [Candidatus Sulfotelmatobacter sp.]
MKIVLLNWRNGENDPFTYFNQCLKDAFEQLGRPTRIIDIDQAFSHNLHEAHSEGIDFVFTWQGLGSGAGSDHMKSTTLWDDLKIPLVCYHGDHPCHMPGNHKAMSPWIRHVYAVASFASFANAYIPRGHGAIAVQPPIWFPNAIHHRFNGDYFVVAKNLDDNEIVFSRWRNAPQRRTAAFLAEAASAIISEVGGGNRTNHHRIIEQMLSPAAIGSLSDELNGAPELMVRMHIHGLLDKVYRNTLAEHVVAELADVPLKIYGRGWERFKAQANPKHEFLSFDSMSDNAFQYASNYGILDVAPTNDSLHDRTLRAMANGAGFLIGSRWPDELLLGKPHDALLFDSSPDSLRCRAQAVMKSPETHREACRDFARQYRTHFSIYDFLKVLESVARSIYSS